MISRVSLGSIPSPHLLVRAAAADAELDSPTGEVIDHGYALGDLHGMVIGQDDDPEAQPDAVGHSREGGDDHLWSGRA